MFELYNMMVYSLHWTETNNNWFLIKSFRFYYYRWDIKKTRYDLNAISIHLFENDRSSHLTLRVKATWLKRSINIFEYLDFVCNLTVAFRLDRYLKKELISEGVRPYSPCLKCSCFETIRKLSCRFDRFMLLKTVVVDSLERKRQVRFD
jgi:hypothetical protein